MEISVRKHVKVESVETDKENFEPMFDLLIKATFWSIAPKGVTMEEMFQAWSAVKLKEKLGATGGTLADDTTNMHESARASMYELFISHLKYALKLDFDKVCDWPVERQISETSKRIREAPMVTSRFTRGRDPVPFIPPCEENNHAITVIFDYLNKKMKDERRGEMTDDDWQFLRSLDHFDPREMQYNPMTWAYLYGLWAHSMNVTESLF